MTIIVNALFSNRGQNTDFRQDSSRKWQNFSFNIGFLTKIWSRDMYKGAMWPVGVNNVPPLFYTETKKGLIQQRKLNMFLRKF